MTNIRLKEILNAIENKQQITISKDEVDIITQTIRACKLDYVISKCKDGYVMIPLLAIRRRLPSR